MGYERGSNERVVIESATLIQLTARHLTNANRTIQTGFIVSA